MRIADCSLLAFVDILIKINRDPQILSYKRNSELLKNVPNFRVSMGFGLHTGWAIEGAIGSSYKIDASYLSPNVNMSARLEAATQQYGVEILISGQIFDLLSIDLKSICRLIDLVTVKGSVEPIRLYTIDLNLKTLKPSKKIKKDLTDKQKKEKQLLLKDEYSSMVKGNSLTQSILKKRQFKKVLQNARPREFYIDFHLGFRSYLEGDWVKAAKHFKVCLDIFEDDGPVKTLFEFIKTNDFKKPNDWKGYRVLTSK